MVIGKQIFLKQLKLLLGMAIEMVSKLLSLYLSTLKVVEDPMVINLTMTSIFRDLIKIQE